jgi:hypothetical protein
MDCGDSFLGEQREEQEQEQEQEEGCKDVFPGNFEAVDVESDDSSTNHEKKPPISCQNSAPAFDFNDDH